MSYLEGYGENNFKEIDMDTNNDWKMFMEARIHERMPIIIIRSNDGSMNTNFKGNF